MIALTSKASLSRSESNIMRTWLDSVKSAIAFESRGKDLLDFLLARTLEYGKYAERLHPKQIICGYNTPNLFHLGLGFKDARVLRYHRQALLDNGTLLWRHQEPHIYILNLPGLSRFLRTLELQNTLTAWPLIEGILTKMEMDYERRYYAYKPFPNWEMRMEIVMANGNMTERHPKAIKNAKATTKRKLEQKKQKRAAALSYDDIYALMKGYAEDAEVAFYDEPTKKLRGQVRNWLNYCAEMERDPRDILKQVVENWFELANAELTNDEGKNISLDAAVSFTQYFTFRRQIHAYLASSEADKKSRPDVVDDAPTVDEVMGDYVW